MSKYVTERIDNGDIKQTKKNIIAVDFDGTLCTNKYPDIGEPNKNLIAYLKKRQSNGDKLILWTSRNEDQTRQAVEWCKAQGLTFDAVNENLPEIIEAFGGDSRKIFANEYIDDRNLMIELFREKSNMELWAENEVALACKHEAPKRKDGEWDYGCACYESALKAFKSLCKDGHSGMSIGFTKTILNRMIDRKPLMPIEDTEDAWNLCTLDDDGSIKQYQCKRMSSLFKYVAEDGTVTYSDVDRYCCINNDNHNASYHCGLVDRVMNELYPIRMPYIPFDKSFKVYTEDFLTDSKNGSFDTMGLLYAIDPHGRRIEINRYFKNALVGFDEIDKTEYDERKEMAKKRQEQ